MMKNSNISSLRPNLKFNFMEFTLLTIKICLIARKPSLWRVGNHGIMGWFGMEKILKIISFHPLSYKCPINVPWVTSESCWEGILAFDNEDFHWSKQSGNCWKNSSRNITELRNRMGKPDFSTVLRSFLGTQEWEGHCGLARAAPQATHPITFPITWAVSCNFLPQEEGMGLSIPIPSAFQPGSTKAE